jgi:Tfp pilus assembly protein PilW
MGPLLAMKPQHSQQGFTLVELLLYVALTGTMLFALSTFFMALLQARVKNQAIAEVEQQGLQVIQSFTQVARNAQAITAPVAGSSANSTTFDVVLAGDDPTIFDISGGQIRIKEGAAAAIPLTSTSVTASGLTFTNLTIGTTDGTERIEFTLTYVNPSGRNEFDYSKTFYASATIRF